MKRVYDAIIEDHLRRYRQMAFVIGPRQVGKTTTCRSLGNLYYDWDSEDHRRLVIAGQQALAAHAGLDKLRRGKRPVVVFDELHKYTRWRNFLKGLFDVFGERCRVVVTGSSRLDTYRRGGDSMMGRYFLFHMHPLSIAELLSPRLPKTPIRPPRKIGERRWQRLYLHGGFPEPYINDNLRFSRRWHDLRRTQLIREDLRELTRIQEVNQLEHLYRMLCARSGDHIVVASLANDLGISPHTIKHWIDLLVALHHGFLVRPWFRSIDKALRKEPKWFLRDWSAIDAVRARSETFVACHLLKAVDGWTDLGFGRFELRYLRDKQKREVDFLVVRDDTPWFLVEVKHAEDTLSPSLHHFQALTGAQHAFQVVIEEDYVDADCFGETRPIMVPARTLLSQLL